MQVDYQFDSEAIQVSLKRLRELGADFTPITRGIAAELESVSQRAFQTERDPTTGKPWTPWSPKYKAQLAAKGKDGSILSRSGELAKSLTTDFDAVSAVIGSNFVYAAIHQLGGTPDMPAAPAAVPARPYMGLSKDGILTIIEIIDKTLLEAIKGESNTKI